MPPADITVRGWHDSTRLFDIQLTAAELALLGRIADLTVTAAAEPCMPTLHVEWAPTSRPDGATCGECYEPISDDSRQRNRYGSWIHLACLDTDTDTDTDPAAPTAETGA